MGNVLAKNVKATIVEAEFLMAETRGEDDDRPNGTYLTVRLHRDVPISAGEVLVLFDYEAA